MPLQKRQLKATFEMPGGEFVLDESLELSVAIKKDCLNLQSTCDIQVVNLTTSMREQLTEFTAWNKRLAQSGVNDHPAYINVKVEAGYAEGGGAVSGTTTVFVGQVVEARLTSPNPNLGMSIHCASRQIDKLRDSAFPPQTGTFKEYVIWAAGQMGVSKVDCETSRDDVRIPNLFTSVFTVDALLWTIQSVFRPFVVAYIDNDRLVVRDLNKALSSEQVVYLEEFIGAPMWTDYGATFTALFDQRIHLGGLVNIKSKLNPSLGSVSSWLVFGLDYMLTSRETPFYMSGIVYPPAS